MMTFTLGKKLTLGTLLLALCSPSEAAVTLRPVISVPEPNKNTPDHPSPSKLPQAAAWFLELYALPPRQSAPVAPVAPSSIPATNTPPVPAT